MTVWVPMKASHARDAVARVDCLDAARDSILSETVMTGSGFRAD